MRDLKEQLQNFKVKTNIPTFLFPWNYFSMRVRKQKIKVHRDISQKVFQDGFLLAIRQSKNLHIKTLYSKFLF